MANLLASFMPTLSELIMKANVAEGLPSISMPDFPEVVAPQLPENPLLKGRVRVDPKISEETKKEIENKAKEVKESVEKALEEQKKLVENACANNAAKTQEIQMDIADMGVALGELVVTCAGLPVRLALAPASIIGSCPLGPTVQPTQLVMTLKQMKEMGDDLGVKYNKVESCYNKLGLDRISEIASSNPLFNSIPGVSALTAVLQTVTTTISSTLAVAKVGITIVGGSISSVSASIPSSPMSGRMLSMARTSPRAGSGFSMSSPEESGSEVEMEAPSIDYDASPETCFAFSPKRYINQKENIYDLTVENCKTFTILNTEKPSPNCKNCTKFKAYSPDVTKKVNKNEQEIFGEGGTEENPKEGSILARISSTESRCTVLESRATKVESRCTSLESRAKDLEDRSTKLEGRAESLETRATDLEDRADKLETRATNLENRAKSLEERADKLEKITEDHEGRIKSLEGRIFDLEDTVNDKVGWSIEASIDDKNGNINVDLKNSKGTILSPKPNGHSASFSYSSIASDTSLESISRIDIYSYDKLDNTLKGEAQQIENNYTGKPTDPTWKIPANNSIWGVNPSSKKIEYKADKIPFENRVHGMSCMVFTLSNSEGADVAPIWINATLFGTYYNFSTKAVTEDTKKYLSLEFEAVDEGFAKSVLATYKYTPAAT